MTKKISQLPAATAVDTDDEFVINQNGTTKKVTTASDWEFNKIIGNAVTQTATDTTAGRLLKVADFGVGSTSINLSNLANDNLIIPTQFVRFRNDIDGLWGGAAGATWNAGFVVRGFSDRQTVFASRYTGSVPELHVGNWSSSTTDPINWVELYHTGNLLGTVSESGGVPTGAVIERGSNGSGRWVRFANGTQIVEHQILLENFDVNTANGSLFASANQTYTWPIQFASGDIPFASITKMSGSGENAGVFGFEIMTGSLVTSMTYRVISTISKTNLAQLPIRVFAIGRWFI